jgi:glucose-1-phosphatase
MKISAICFDLGKVLLDFDKEAMLVRMAQKSPLTPQEMGALIQKDKLHLAYETGDITSAKFFSHLKKILHYKGTTKELRAAYNEIFTPLPEHIALAALLAPHYPLAIISNTNEAHILHAEATYSFFSLFRARIYSHQVKAMKPEKSIYQAALTALGGIDPLEALFIDDIEDNILGAVKLGWQTIHLRPGVDLREALASYELKGLDHGGVGPNPPPDSGPEPQGGMPDGFKSVPFGGAPAKRPYPE